MEEHGNSIVRELLDEYNYEEWSIQMKTYLLAQGLWDIVKKCGVRTPKRNEKAKLKVWTRKNAEALHVIQRSCGEDSFGVIKEITSAKIAWATLAYEYGPKPLGHSEAENIEKAKESNIGVVQESSLEKKEKESNSDNPPGTDPINGDFQRHRPLFDAVGSGNWNAAKTYLDQHPDAVRARIHVSDRTPLHIAVSAGHLHIVEELVQLMTEEDLLIQQKDGFTVLAVAIHIGSIPIAKCLIKKNKELVNVVHRTNGIPVIHSVLYSDFQMARYLYSVTSQDVLTLRDNGKTGASLISFCILNNKFDIPLDLLKHCPGLAITVDQFNKSPLLALSRCSKSLFPSRCQLGFWQRWVYDYIDVADCTTNQITLGVQNQECTESDKNDFTAIRSVLVGVLARMPSILLQLLDVKVIYETKLVHVQYLELLSRICKVLESTSDANQVRDAGVYAAIMEAVCNGDVEFIMNILKANPELVWNSYLARDMFMLAIELRQAEVFSLIYGLPDKQAIASLQDANGNNMLHKAASVPSSRILNLIPGAALQMQRQLQWFKEVETIMLPSCRGSINKEGLRPLALFTKKHKELVVAGEDWMKDTSTSCIIVGALIVIITFAAAFTVPGENNQETGFSISTNKKLFKVFIMSDVMSLFLSTTSVLVFLGIFTSRYAEEDFLISLPKKMVIGLSTLFFSIATAMIAFCVSVPLMLPEKWIAPLVGLLASVPINFFVWMKFPLLVDIYMSTFGSSIFNRNVNPWLYG